MMTQAQSPNQRQRGVALLVVLLLIASLGFVALSITERTALAAARSVNERARSEAIWRGFGAETLAVAALQEIVKTSNGVMALDDAWASEPIDIPMENGTARILFADATACFNINSLAKAPASNTSLNDSAPEFQEFALLARNLGLSEFEGIALAEVIADWVDADSNRRPQGAEDEYYTLLPSPYRTGNQFAASVSELRAMKGVSRDIYAGLKPYLCAQPSDFPSPVNINMLSDSDAPLLAAILGEDVTVLQAQDIIAARPPGGYRDMADFLNQPGIKALELEQDVISRFRLNSQYLQARAEIVYDTTVLEMTSDLMISDNGVVRVSGRRFGAEE